MQCPISTTVFLFLFFSIGIEAFVPCHLKLLSQRIQGDIARHYHEKFQSKNVGSRFEEQRVIAATLQDETESVVAKEEDEDESLIRPLHQNWWPVTLENALKKDRPNAVELLNEKLVLFWSDGEWKCLDDRCSHRFAPLSEGRVITMDNGACHLECAYHGWQFDGQGTCQKVPQSKSSPTTAGRCVTNYPVQIVGSMVFVWADPSSYESLGRSVEIATFPALLDSAAEWKDGESRCFMRDLPYGMELLGENLLDLSHLPFSHHGVGSLNRERGGELPFQMLSKDQKSPDQPYLEASLQDAINTDPIAFPNTPPSYNLKLGFYAPCHVRYTREFVPGKAFYTAMYLCPISNAKSRVFLFNLSNMTPPPPQKPSNKFLVLRKKIKSLFNPQPPNPFAGPLYQAHLRSHEIFDGDGIFLHKQGDRMQRSSLSYKDYHTPTAADILINAYRRYLNLVSKTTRSAGLETMADAVMPQNGQGYKDDLPRELMLDRYESHTKHCKVCMDALTIAQTKKKRLEILQTALIGVSGASSVTLITSLILRLVLVSNTNALSWLLRVSALTTASGIASYRSISKKYKPQVEKEIQQFYFEDYIHADKH